MHYGGLRKTTNNKTYFAVMKILKSCKIVQKNGDKNGDKTVLKYHKLWPGDKVI